jgi:Signal transduction histidine kinase
MAVALNHEINNPLQVIQGNAQLLYVQPTLTPEAREKVARIRAATETIAGLTQRIAALRDVVTVDYPAGNRTTVPMVNFKASLGAPEASAPRDAQAKPGDDPEIKSRESGRSSPESGS